MCELKVVYSFLWEAHCRGTESRLPYGIKQLPAPDTDKRAHALTPARQAGSRFTYLEGMEG